MLKLLYSLHLYSHTTLTAMRTNMYMGEKKHLSLSVLKKRGCGSAQVLQQYDESIQLTVNFLATLHLVYRVGLSILPVTKSYSDRQSESVQD